MNQSQSVPGIPQALNDPEYVNINARHKRPRLDDSANDQLEEFKLEIKQMLASWKQDHDDSIKKMMADQTALVTKLISDVAELKLQNLQIQKTNIELEKSSITTSELYDDMKNQVKRLQDECKEYKKYTESLEKTVRDLQYKSRSSTVEVRNVLIQPNESTDDLTKIMMNIAKAVDLPISSTNIRDIYRVPSMSTSTNKAIIAEFTSVQTKTELISRVRGFNNKHANKEDKLNSQLIGLSGQKQPIYVDEHLCLSAKKLYYAARQYAKQHEYKFCWSSNGNIFLRKQVGQKQILIKSEATLLELQENK
ncbi:uncharacterized protein LOC113493109 [Trichoplusia ni]|uniref:Uncharacterized protein LOC113493109 n=1 Tax=Trichoplusia ni TaxID=7111 RepID=A0A7E5VEP4_TRINI|nr:uncharacterized protein LOC113493109 [Trichoplusia ni]